MPWFGSAPLAADLPPAVTAYLAPAARVGTGTLACPVEPSSTVLIPKTLRRTLYRYILDMSRYIPLVAEWVFHPGVSGAVGLVGRFPCRSGASFERTLIHRVCIFHIDMERGGPGFPTPGKSGAATTDHQHGIANSDFAMDAASGPNGAKSLLGSERLLREVDQCR